MALFIAGAGLVLGLLVTTQRNAIAHLEDRVAYLESSVVPLRFMVLSRSDESVSARFRFYDAGGREIGAFERSWRGSELYIDSVVVPLDERRLVFPSKVFTNATAPRGGTELFGYYDRDGFPGIYAAPSLDRQARDTLKEIFAMVKRSERGVDERPTRGALSGAYGNAVHDIRQFSSFEVGAVYALVVRPTGGIELVRE